MNFFLCFTKNRKKIDKYFKVNRIKNKVIIDINQIIEDENINTNDADNLRTFKLIVWYKFQEARTKKKDIYYIPNFSTNKDIMIENLLSYKELVPTYNYNLLCLYTDMVGTKWLDEIFDHLDFFDNTQILKDY